MKLKKLIPHIPRQVQVFLYIVGLLLLTAVYYISIGCPTLTFEQEFRRAEKANLVGPSRIVDTLDQEYEEFEKMIVGETEYGVCFFGKYDGGVIEFSGEHNIRYVFSYREKAGDITVVAAPNKWTVLWDEADSITLPLYVFADHPNAVRAEIEVSIAGTHTESVNGQKTPINFSQTYTGSANRLDTGVFRFFLKANTINNIYALELLSNVSCGNKVLSEDEKDAVIPVVVRLYDKNDDLIVEQSLTILPNDTP